MSSRVQKGNTVFRPRAKARGRPVSTTPAPETRDATAGLSESGLGSVQNGSNAGPMPPPLDAHSRLSSMALARTTALGSIGEEPRPANETPQSQLSPPFNTQVEEQAQAIMFTNVGAVGVPSSSTAPPTEPPPNGRISHISPMPIPRVNRPRNTASHPISAPSSRSQSRSIHPRPPARKPSATSILTRPESSSSPTEPPIATLPESVDELASQVRVTAHSQEPLHATRPFVFPLSHTPHAGPSHTPLFLPDPAQDYGTTPLLDPLLTRGYAGPPSSIFLDRGSDESTANLPTTSIMPQGPVFGEQGEYLPTEALDALATHGPPQEARGTLADPGNPVKRPRRGKSRGKPGKLNEGASTEEGSESDPKLRSKRVTRSRRAAASDQDEEAPTSRKRRSQTTTPTAAASSATDGESDGSTSRKRKRRSSATSSSGPRRGRRTRDPTPPYDGSAQGVELDPTVTTMAQLCSDPGTGRVSSKAAQIIANHTAWKAASREKRAKMRALSEAKKYGRPEEDEPHSKGEGADEISVQTRAKLAGSRGRDEEEARATDGERNTPGTSGGDGDSNIVPDQIEHEGNATGGFDYSQTVQTNRFNVQVRIGPNGETILDDQSLFIERADEEDETAGYTHVEESDQTKFTNSMSYSRKMRGSRWSAEETEMFFDALCQFGENFELIALILPGRDRKQCKAKYKAEDRKNPARITWCLKNRIPYDMDTLARLTGKDFSGPTPDIRVPTPPTTVDPARNGSNEAAAGSIEGATTRTKRKKSRASAVQSNGEEILGAAEDFVDKDD